MSSYLARLTSERSNVFFVRSLGVKARCANCRERRIVNLLSVYDNIVELCIECAIAAIRVEIETSQQRVRRIERERMVNEVIAHMREQKVGLTFIRSKRSYSRYFDIEITIAPAAGDKFKVTECKATGYDVPKYALWGEKKIQNYLRHELEYFELKRIN